MSSKTSWLWNIELLINLLYKPVVSITCQVTSYTHELLLFEGNVSYMIPIIMTPPTVKSMPFLSRENLCCLLHLLVACCKRFQCKIQQEINLWDGNCEASKLNSILKIRLSTFQILKFIYIYITMFSLTVFTLTVW